jgi:hypothetical protein
MKWNNRIIRNSVAALTIQALGLSGCMQYTIETTLNADGSGVRHEELMVEEVEVDVEGHEAGFSIASGDFADLMHVRESDRWSYTLSLEDEDTIHVFRRETRVTDLASWADLSGDVHIAGATTADARTRVGHIELGDVQLRNTVRVQTGAVTEGVSFVYREAFYWDNLLDALVEWFVGYVSSTVDAQYPDLTAEERGEITGFVKGGLWSAIDQGLLDSGGDEEERFVSAFIDRAAEQSMKIIRRRYPDGDVESFKNMLRQIYEDEDDKLGSFIEARLPGVQLATATEIIYRLNMPGRVTASNAHDRDGTTLVWEFGLVWEGAGDAVTAPLEIFAESVVDR